MFDLQSYLPQRRGPVETQIDALRREIAHLTRLVSHAGNKGYDEARHAGSDFYAELVDAVGEAMPAVRRSARRAGRTARNHPGTLAAAASLIVLGLVATLFMTRK